MNPIISKLVNSLNLLPHPEGGWYAETYRSEQVLDSSERNILTSIYFLITSENVSRFHKIKSDELWYFHQGSTLTVHTLDENGHTENKLGLNLELTKTIPCTKLLPFVLKDFWVDYTGTVWFLFISLFSVE